MKTGIKKKKRKGAAAEPTERQQQRRQQRHRAHEQPQVPSSSSSCVCALSLLFHQHSQEHLSADMANKKTLFPSFPSFPSSICYWHLARRLEPLERELFSLGLDNWLGWPALGCQQLTMDISTRESI